MTFKEYLKNNSISLKFDDVLYIDNANLDDIKGIE